MEENYKEKYEKFKTNSIWSCVILSIIIISLLTVIIYSHKFQNVELGDLISISSGLVSIALAIIAIIYSISESIKNSNKEKELNRLVNDLNTGSKELKSDINELRNKIIIDLKNETNNLLEQTEIIRKNYEQFNIMDNTNENTDYTDYMKNKCDEGNLACNYIGDIKISDDKEEKNDISIINLYGINNELKNVNTNSINIKRGDIVYVQENLHSPRKYVVLQNNIANKFSNMITVAPITARKIKHKLPTHVELLKENNIEEIILVERITFIRSSKIIEKVGELNKNLIYKLDKAIKVQLDLR
ncbi:type II toxin-antitoxin system PemK/MazF family toxin [Clostridium perfringens]|nr:type II toxin-antitoxin system PemK/MazF family toxin [Clostridium perfringens]ELC8433782.1 type II toxin-antitoxin system PemK/MazF family toxin [Clostridium perfringens]